MASSNVFDAVPKLDKEATAGGLDAIENSLVYRLAEIDRHAHSFERWFGVAAVPNGEVHVADRISPTISVFQADAGNDNWGAWLQIVGSSDTPTDSGNVYFDPHRLFIRAAQRFTNIHFIQIGFGASGAAALAAGTYGEFPYEPQSATAMELSIKIKSRRLVVGTKGWLRLVVPGQVSGTIDFLVGIHEYEG